MHPQNVKQVKEHDSTLEMVERKVREVSRRDDVTYEERHAIGRAADFLRDARKELGKVVLGPVEEGCC